MDPANPASPLNPINPLNPLNPSHPINDDNEEGDEVAREEGHTEQTSQEQPLISRDAWINFGWCSFVAIILIFVIQKMYFEKKKH